MEPGPIDRRIFHGPARGQHYRATDGVFGRPAGSPPDGPHRADNNRAGLSPFQPYREHYHLLPVLWDDHAGYGGEYLAAIYVSSQPVVRAQAWPGHGDCRRGLTTGRTGAGADTGVGGDAGQPRLERHSPMDRGGVPVPGLANVAVDPGATGGLRPATRRRPAGPGGARGGQGHKEGSFAAPVAVHRAASDADPRILADHVRPRFLQHTFRDPDRAPCADADRPGPVPASGCKYVFGSLGSGRSISVNRRLHGRQAAKERSHILLRFHPGGRLSHGGIRR